MILDILFIYIAGGISCGLACAIREYMDLRRSQYIGRDNWIFILILFVMTFLLWPVLFVMVIVQDIRDKFVKKK